MASRIGPTMLVIPAKSKVETTKIIIKVMMREGELLIL